MAGIPAPSLTDTPEKVQAIQALLTTALERLHLEVDGPSQLPVGTPLSASIKGLSLELDVSDLLEGALDAGWLSYAGATVANALRDADAGTHGVDAIRDAVSKAIEDVPAPAAAASVIPNLAATTLNRVMALAQNPRLRVRADVAWHLRNSSGQDLVAGKDFLAPAGLTSPEVTVLLPPLFQELTLDTVSADVTELGGSLHACTYYLSATVVLSVLDVWAALELPALPPYAATPTDVVVGQGGWTPASVPPAAAPVPVVALPLLYPTLVALFSSSAANLSFPPDSENVLKLLLVVPNNSPIGSLQHLNRLLKEIDQQVADLRDLASVATGLLGLDLVSDALDALADHPAARLVHAVPVREDFMHHGFPNIPVLPTDATYPQGVSRFEDIEYHTDSDRFLGVIPYDSDHPIDFDDAARSLIMLGLPGTRATFFNNDTYQSNRGSWWIEVPAVIESGNPLSLLPFVVVPNIPALGDDTDAPGDVPAPDTIPPDRADVLEGTDDGYGGLMSSMYFNQPGLTVTCGGVVPRLSLDCPTEKGGTPFSVLVGEAFSISGSVFPTTLLPGESIVLTYYLGLAPVFQHEVQPDAAGGFSDTATLTQEGVWVVEASLLAPDHQTVLSTSNGCRINADEPIQ
jgi:hypothetical protein